MQDTAIPIDTIRAASRDIVRRLGFMQSDLAGTGMPPSSVHAIIELGLGSVDTARALSDLLGLEKSSVSRMLDKLIACGLIDAAPDPNDRRSKTLRLTTKGRAAFRQIEDHGRKQVGSALNSVPPEDQVEIQTGLRRYAEALRSADDAPYEPPLALHTGYQPTLLGRVTEMHARYYARNFGFGAVFERKVASEMSGFLGRLTNPANTVISASLGGRIIGSVTIDGEDFGPTCAHLRWFILDEAAQGRGVGRRLLNGAMQHVDSHGFAETHLWTFQGLDAARHLYESVGFELVESAPGSRWGTEVIEQRFVRSAPA